MSLEKDNIGLKDSVRVCPLCDKAHDIRMMKRMTSIEIKGMEVQYEEEYYVCDNLDEGENEFVDGKMSDLSLLNARNAYRTKKGLLTSYEIVDIRKQYGVSQVEMAKLLGWGEATISRYESKAIQDEAYDNILRDIRENPFKAYEFWNKNKYKFSATRVNEIKIKIQENMDSIGKEYLKRRNLQSEYIMFQDPSESNGYQTLNIDKLEGVISRLTSYYKELYKMQLMKMLWYADNEAFKEHGKSITGLVYKRDKEGIIPIGYNGIIDLENVLVKEEIEGENVRYKIQNNDSLDMSYLSDEELKIIDKVGDETRNYSLKEMTEFVKNKKEYMDVNDGDIISFK